MEACGIFRTVKMSDASDSTVVLPDPIEPVMISSASVGAIAGLFLCTIITGAGIRKKACIDKLYGGWHTGVGGWDDAHRRDLRSPVGSAWTNPRFSHIDPGGWI